MWSTVSALSKVTSSSKKRNMQTRHSQNKFKKKVLKHSWFISATFLGTEKSNCISSTPEKSKPVRMGIYQQRQPWTVLGIWEHPMACQCPPGGRAEFLQALRAEETHKCAWPTPMHSSSFELFLLFPLYPWCCSTPLSNWAYRIIFSVSLLWRFYRCIIVLTACWCHRVKMPPSEKDSVFFARGKERIIIGFDC